MRASVVVAVVLIFIFLMSEGEYLFICLRAICTSFSVNGAMHKVYPYPLPMFLLSCFFSYKFLLLSPPSDFLQFLVIVFFIFRIFSFVSSLHILFSVSFYFSFVSSIHNCFKIKTFI